MSHAPTSADGVVTILAPAKINLFLHIVGRRPDGRHDLESIFAFADVGDRLRMARGDEFSLSLSGPFSGDLDTNSDKNLVMKAARLLADEVGQKAFPARMELKKNLPVAAGIGGGSADAAAALRGLSALWDIELPAERLRGLALELGADVPACLGPGMVGVKGIGEIIEPCVVSQDRIHAVLVNPKVRLSTAAVFGRYRKGTGDTSDPLDHWPGSGGENLLEALADCQNDLTDAALAEAPVIADVLAELDKQAGCGLARMSGSGATCFGLFDDRSAAKQAAANLGHHYPDWWVAATELR